jgi:hypothetical protein
LEVLLDEWVRLLDITYNIVKLVNFSVFIKPGGARPNNLLYDRNMNELREPNNVIGTVYKICSNFKEPVDLTLNTPILINQPDVNMISIAYCIN